VRSRGSDGGENAASNLSTNCGPSQTFLSLESRGGGGERERERERELILLNQ